MDLCAERACKSHLLPGLLGLPPAASFRGTHHAEGGRAASTSPLWWGLGLLRKGIAMRERVPRQEPWALSSSTFHWKLPLRTPLYLGLFSPKPPSPSPGKCCPLVDVSWNYKCQSGASGRFSHKACRALKNTSLQAMSCVCRGMWGGSGGSQCPEFNLNLT